MANLVTGKLKVIEIDNFKSYRGKQIIGPFSSFTAIIGPNGSGKSNLMDAISFVLGESTKNLRVKRLNDLIHGANFGQPISKSAYVTAVYETSNGDEIRFSRIIHNNTSEYKVNDKSVKIDEYANQLEQLNILMKVKNFLVFQGTVESIAMKNAKERCQMFEEISKSIDYKVEYEKTKEEVRRLEEEATVNLNKKKNIVAERKEAKIEIDEAAKYKKLKGELNSKKIELHLMKLFYNQLETGEIHKDHDNKKVELNRHNAERGEVDENIKVCRKTLAKLHREQGGIEQDIKQCEQEIGKKRPEHIKIYQRLKHLSDKHKETKKAYEASRQQSNANMEEMSQLESQMARIESLKREYEQNQNQLSLEKGRNLELEHNQLQEYHRLKQKVAEKTSHLSAVLDDLTRDYNEKKDIYDALERRRNEIASSQKRKESELNESRKRLQKLREYIESSNRAITEQKEAEEAIRQEVESATKRIEEINRELECVVTQLGEARVEKHESSRAAKKQELIENLKRLFPGVHGRLLEMCQPTHRRYQVAITKVLGKYMDAIVCDTQKTAKDCIQYMKDQRIEPETFLPLDFLDVRPIDEKLREIKSPQNVHLVLDVIQFEPPIIKKALQFACGNALVCDTVEHARTVAFNTGERKKTVSLEGTLFQRSGVISGGASDLKARARRWDEKQINSLVAKRDNLQDELKEQLKKKRKEAELRTIQSQIKGLETRLKYTEKDKNSIIYDTKEEMEEKLLSSNEDEMERMNREMVEVEERILSCNTKMQELQISINSEKLKMDSAEDDVFKDFCLMIGVENIRQYEERELNVAKERDIKLMDFKNQLQKLNTQLDYEKSRNTKAIMDKYAETLEFEKSEIERTKSIESKLKEEMESLENKRRTLETKLTEWKQNCENVDGELADLQRARNAKQRDILKVQKELTQIETRLDSRRADRHSLIQAAKMDDLDLPVKDNSLTIYECSQSQNTAEDMDVGEMNSEEMLKIFKAEENIFFEYKKLDKPLRQLTNENDVNRKVDQMQLDVDSMTRNIERIQTPNLRAGDKLDNVEERLRATESQFEDTRQRARRAKVDFERIKRQRYDKFMNCFNVVVDNIDGIYKSLARNPGAQASLLPTNHEEPYLDEIQFQCVAPGKRFQHMDSLSGGEKTIAALALLFATHSYNPSPFFVLDEIDAALDNTNIGKVASFIREYASDRAQIIVISLKEEFYSRADALIGILPSTDNNILVSEVYRLDLSQYVDAEEP